MIYGRPPILPFDSQNDTVTLAHDPDHPKRLEQYLSSMTKQAQRNIVQNQQRVQATIRPASSRPLLQHRRIGTDQDAQSTVEIRRPLRRTLPHRQTNRVQDLYRAARKKADTPQTNYGGCHAANFRTKISIAESLDEEIRRDGQQCQSQKESPILGRRHLIKHNLALLGRGSAASPAH